MTYEPRLKRPKTKKPLFLLFLVIFSGRMVCWWLFGPDVKVYVEGSYTDYEVQADIYADVYVSCLQGFGVQIFYQPLQLTVASAEENDDFLYTPDHILNHYNKLKATPIDLPDTATPLEGVVFVGNIPDKGCGNKPGCRACITGRRVLLGTVTFNRVEHEMPFDPSNLFITFASGNNTTDPLRDFDKDIGHMSMKTGSSNVRLEGNQVKFGSIRIKESS
ncbi:MAG: hypothetical protein ACQ9MH_24235 [Nitrospinales bacterium]